MNDRPWTYGHRLELDIMTAALGYSGGLLYCGDDTEAMADDSAAIRRGGRDRRRDQRADRDRCGAAASLRSAGPRVRTWQGIGSPLVANTSRRSNRLPKPSPHAFGSGSELLNGCAMPYSALMKATPHPWVVNSF